ncbi:MAG: esterase-like activity of phytase family protein [Motiliproteus sp.]|nr:esterase-like activity of phytase family protein [Motiliproteus sp.]
MGLVKTKGLIETIFSGLAALLLAWAATARADEPQQLKLIRALEVYSASEIGALQPSGLAYCDGRLLMVSDRHNQTVFTFRLEQDRAIAEPWIQLGDIPSPELDSYPFGQRWLTKISRRYDWEGVSCDAEGRLYLVSEALAQVLVRESDGRLHWLGAEAYHRGRELGLFEHTNAFAEGLAVSGDGMVMVAERQPRGLVFLHRQAGNWNVQQVRYLSGFPSLVRPDDFSGVLLEERGVYTLERNHFKVCRRSLMEFTEEQCWGYRSVEESPALRYEDRRYGKAEGLARNGSRLYLVLDNNEDARAVDSGNRRPLLFVFQQPQNW